MKLKSCLVVVQCGMAASLLNAADVDVVASQLVFSTQFGVNTLPVATTSWTNNNTYILTDVVVVPEGGTLVIEEGTKIYSSVHGNGTSLRSDDKMGALVVARGGQLIAEGTAEEPIVFDALETLEVSRGLDLSYDDDAAVGPAPTNGTSGLWGGVVVLGNGYVGESSFRGRVGGMMDVTTFNSSYDRDGDGFVDVANYGVDPRFPTANNHGDSGSLAYVSIRHAGYDKYGSGSMPSYGGLTLAGVGDSTVVEHVEVTACLGDCVRILGGSVNTSNLVAALSADDCFEIGQGHDGIHQFWFGLQEVSSGGNLLVLSGMSDNAFSNPSAFDPADAIIYNATFIGRKESSDSSGRTHGGLLYQNGFRGSVVNSVFEDLGGALAYFDTSGLSNTKVFANNTVGQVGTYDSGAAIPPATVFGSSSWPTNFYVNTLEYALYGTLRDGNSLPGEDPGFLAFGRNVTTGEIQIVEPRARRPYQYGEVTHGGPQFTMYRGAFDDKTNWALGWTLLDEFGYFGQQVEGNLAFSNSAPTSTGLDDLTFTISDVSLDNSEFQGATVLISDGGSLNVTVYLGGFGYGGVVEELPDGRLVYFISALVDGVGSPSPVGNSIVTALIDPS